MIIFTVHEPERPAPSVEERADTVVFVKEGFTIWGFLFGPFWLLYNRAWLAALLTVGAIAVLTALLDAAGIGKTAAIVNILVSLIIGFEGNDILRWSLERKGYAFLTSVAGRNRLECERRFFDAWLPRVASSGAPGTPLKSWGASLGSGIGSWPGATA